MKILMVASECYPFAKSGGLGDVLGSLPAALRKLNLDVRVVLPAHASIAEEYRQRMEPAGSFRVKLGWRDQGCDLAVSEYGGVPFYWIGNGYYFGRDDLYGYYDEAERYAFFCRAVTEALSHIDFSPHLIHAHDWQSALVSVFLRTLDAWKEELAGIPVLQTVHNLQYQGQFSGEILEDILGLGGSPEAAARLDQDGNVNFLKGGLCYADAVSTVSRSYAGEIQTPFYGEGLHTVLAGRPVHGITNGIDERFFDPLRDPMIAHRYRTPGGKRPNKEHLQRTVGLPVSPDVPLVAIVSRLVAQKGWDLVERVLPTLLEEDLQMMVLGSGERRYEELFLSMAQRYPSKAAACIHYDEALAHQIYAAADLLLMPSLFEPCGLSQMIAMRYGCLPVVRETGGLRDTVQPYDAGSGAGNGFSFPNYNAHDMLFTVQRALALYREGAPWKRLAAQAMRGDFSWEKAAGEYRNLYASMLTQEE